MSEQVEQARKAIDEVVTRWFGKSGYAEKMATAIELFEQAVRLDERQPMPCRFCGATRIVGMVYEASVGQEPRSFTPLLKTYCPNMCGLPEHSMANPVLVTVNGGGNG